MTHMVEFPEVLKWANKGFDLFFPTVCVVCGKLGPMICTDCLSQLPRVNEPLCHRCGHALFHPANVCEQCMQSSFHLHQVRAPFLYREPIKSIIHKMKYEGLFALTKPLAQLMANSWPAWEKPPDVLMPIPLHPRRKKKRGFNQSALLATHLGRQLGLNTNLVDLRRVRNTAPQVGLNPQKRIENVHGAFEAGTASAKDKQILLIDDVFTTGATMLAAAEALYSAGAKSVSAYCLARTV